MSKRADDASAMRLKLWSLLNDPVNLAVVVEALLPQQVRLAVVTEIVKAQESAGRTEILTSLTSDPSEGVKKMATEALRPRPVLHKLEGKTR